jgi:arginase family enzyme
MVNKTRPKLFGVALDASDDPFSLQLKHASIYARQQGQQLQEDPYQAVVEQLLGRKSRIDLAGRFPLPSWLGPRPGLSDQTSVNQRHMQCFLDDDGPLKTAEKVKDFVLDKILPGLPIMVGIDHSTTGGVVAALSAALGPESLTVIVLDRHFDALPLSVRMGPLRTMDSTSTLDRPGPLQAMPSEDGYCCGNFWAHLIERGVVLPERLLLVGVADYPEEKIAPEWEAFRDSYLEFEYQGCSFFPLREFDGPYGKRLEQFLRQKVKTPYVYVSLDLDVGSYRCVHAARYMDGPGIDERALLYVARTIAKGCRSGLFSLVGLDVMEFNMHLVGLESEQGVQDKTVATALDFIDALVTKETGRLSLEQRNL